MEPFVDKLRRDYAQVAFKEAAVASWSPHTQQVSYTGQGDEASIWSMLHELGHALLGHTSYESDMNLLRKEVEAWEKALSIAESYDIVIHPDHIQNCLDTYRDWLHKRSTCPTCGSHGVQQSKALYCCLNCKDTWKVSSARFCRPYRLKSPQTQQKSPR